MTDDVLDLAVVDDGEDDGDLTPKEALFCEAFGNPESATFGNGTKSARVAKYVSPRNAAWKLRKRPRVQARLAEMHKLALVDIGQVMSGIEHCRLAAAKKADWAVVAKCLELMGKRLGAWVDVAVVDTVALQEFDERKAIEAHHLARLRLEEAGAAGLGVLPPEKQLNSGSE